jgi:HK97 family phage major capsid protein
VPPLYWPAGAFGKADATLKGRPIIIAEQCPQLGTVGDITLCDLSQYVLVEGPLVSAISADVQFLSGQIVYRLTLRVDGKPIWASPITPFNGGATRSPFVKLAAR